MHAGGMGWAASAMQCSIKLRYYVTTAVGKVAVNWIQLCRSLASGDLHIFHESREMEISVRESSRRNLARIIRYSRMQAMPYSCIHPIVKM